MNAAALKAAFLDGLRAGLAGKAITTGERWAERDPALPRMEARASAWTVARWRALRDDVLDVLGLRAAPRVTKAPIATEPWRFDPTLTARLLALGERFTRDTASADGVLVRAFWEAWVRGYANAGRELNRETEIGAQQVAIRMEIRNRGLELVRNVTARRLRGDIVAELTAGAYDGMNPVNIARALRDRFAAADHDWERLARTEIAMAQSDAKLLHYREAGIQQVDYVTAGDERVSTICQTLAAGGPYAMAAAPVPGRDSHPNCRCTLVARIPD